MGKYTKYRLYQKYETRGSQEAIPVYPNTFSIDGDGTMPVVIIEENSRDCGYTGDTQPIYRWYNMPIDKYYVCDECAANFKIKAVYTGGMTYSAACDNSTELTSGETRPSDYRITAMTSAVIGSCVTVVGYRALYSCTSLSSLTIGNNVVTIEDYAFFYNRSLTSVVIPNKVTSIGDYAFQVCRSLTSVTIGNSVATIGSNAFGTCSGLTSLNLPNSVSSIGSQAFQSCSSLTSVTIGNGITSIGSQAFGSCSGLTSITINATTPPTLGSNALNLSSDCPIYVPAASVETYKAASGWSSYADRIQAIP